MSIHLGDFALDVPAHVQMFVDSQVEFSVFEVDKKGKVLHFLGNSVDRKWKATVTKDCKLKFDVAEHMHTAVDARPIKPPHEVVSDIPVEVEVDLPPKDLQQQIKEFAALMVTERYGRDSEEVDTFEEMMDFDIPDDDDMPLTGYEVQDVVPEEVPIVEEEEPPPPEPEQDPPPPENP
jgi:hypothetical protein